MKHLWQVLSWLVFLGFLTLNTAHAQSTLTYGTGIVGTLAADTPIGLYTFQGSAGDNVTLQVIGLSPGLQPAISLNSALGAQIGSSSSDALNPTSAAARLTARLSDDGLYTVIVAAVGGGVGDYALRLDGVATANEITITDETTQTEVVDGTSVLLYTVAGIADVPQAVTISMSGASAAFSVTVTDATASTVTIASGTDAQAALLTLPPSDGFFTLQVAVNATANAILTLDIAPLTINDEEVDGDISTATAIPPTPVDDPVIETITPSATATFSDGGEEAATQSANATPTQTATVSNDEPTATQEATSTETEVDIGITATATSTATATETAVNETATPTATHTATATTPAATATFTPSYTPTTPPAAQVAPEDARFNNPLTIPLDNTASVLDFVSYPGGDREDRVRYSVSGMNNIATASGGRARLVISVTCFGENTDQIEIFTGGSTYRCGDTLVDREVTADSNTGSVIITAVGGDGTYVQWVLTGTATRVN